MAVTVALYSLLGLWDFAKSELLPDRFQALTVVKLTPHLSWRTWLIGLLVIIIIVLFEGANAAIWKREAELQTLRDALAAAKRGNRPSVAPRSYKRQEDGRCGLTVTNAEYAAYDVHIPDAPIGDSGYLLQFNGRFAQVLHLEQVFFETWLINRNGLPGRGGCDLGDIMRDAEIEAVYFGIISKDTSPIPNWYRDNCVIKRDVASSNRNGLLLNYICKELMPEPTTRPA